MHRIPSPIVFSTRTLFLATKNKAITITNRISMKILNVTENHHHKGAVHEAAHKSEYAVSRFLQAKRHIRHCNRALLGWGGSPLSVEGGHHVFCGEAHSLFFCRGGQPVFVEGGGAAYFFVGGPRVSIFGPRMRPRTIHKRQWTCPIGHEVAGRFTWARQCPTGPVGQDKGGARGPWLAWMVFIFYTNHLHNIRKWPENKRNRMELHKQCKNYMFNNGTFNTSLGLTMGQKGNG